MKLMKTFINVKFIIDSKYYICENRYGVTIVNINIL